MRGMTGGGGVVGIRVWVSDDGGLQLPLDWCELDVGIFTYNRTPSLRW